MPVDLAWAERPVALLGAPPGNHVAFGTVAGERFAAAVQAPAQKPPERVGSLHDHWPVPALLLRQKAAPGLVLRGTTNREIGEVLHFSDLTFEARVAAVSRKMEVGFRSKLIARLHCLAPWPEGSQSYSVRRG